MNVIQFVQKYADDSFIKMPFTEVDGVICSALSYLPLEIVFEDMSNQELTISNVVKKLSQKRYRYLFNTFFGKKVYRLLVEMSKTKRYHKLCFKNYWKVVNKNCQFAAITLVLPDHTLYVSFEGTDTAISGWKEDACMAYQFPVPAQELACEYLENAYEIFGKNIRVGGHSKGGNLAVYAAMMVPRHVQRKIIAVHNNDGPGFPKRIVDTAKYQRILPKIHTIVPQESVIGMFLYHQEEMIPVKSNRRGIFQHDLFHWQIEGIAFQREELSMYSKKIFEKTNHWLDTIESNDRKKCFESIFHILDTNAIFDTHDLLSIPKSIKVVKRMADIDTQSKQNLLDALRILV